MNKLFFLLYMTPLWVWGQNLVPNPGFENRTGCPTASCQWNLATDWTNISGRIGCGTANAGTPDYFNTCGTGNLRPPATRYGVLAPRTGAAMMGISTLRPFSVNFREYLSVQLDSTLQAGIPYEVSFAYANGATGSGSTGGTGTELALHFSNGPLTQVGRNPIILTPSFETNGTVYSTDWSVITFTYTPTAAVNHLTIGNFRNDANTTSFQYVPPSFTGISFAYYFIDDVSVTRTRPLDAGITEPLTDIQSSNTEDRIYMYDQKLILKTQDTERQRVQLTISDIHGKVVQEQSIETTGRSNVSLPSLAAGMYVAHLQTRRGVKAFKFWLR